MITVVAGSRPSPIHGGATVSAPSRCAPTPDFQRSLQSISGTWANSTCDPSARDAMRSAIGLRSVPGGNDETSAGPSSNTQPAPASNNASLTACRLPDGAMTRTESHSGAKRLAHTGPESLRPRRRRHLHLRQLADQLRFVGGELLGRPELHTHV